MIKYTLILLPLLLTACDTRYRYPCQDPSNWDTPECKKPICEVNKDCPEYIFKDENVKPSARPPVPAVRGDCK